MESIYLSDLNLDQVVAAASAVLRQGGVVLYPTDTLYALAVDAFNKDALEKIYQIKGRDEGKPIHSIVKDLPSIAPYAVVTPLAELLAEKFLPGPLTLLLTKKPSVPSWAVAEHDTFGVRVPDNSFCLLLAKEFGSPYTATSANKSGQKTELSAEGILKQLGKDAEKIDLVVDAGVLASPPSTVVDARGSKPIIVREGAISTEKVLITQ